MGHRPPNVVERVAANPSEWSGAGRAGRRAANGVDAAWIGWTTALLPAVAMHAAYLLSAASGHVPWCIPYLDGCTSMSRAAREGHSILVFRALMVPWVVLLAAFWVLAAQWTRELAPAARGRRRTMLALGLVAATFYLLYATFLGVEGATPEWLRRYGVNLYLGGSVLAKMLLVSQIPAEARIPVRLRRALLVVCALLLGLGLAGLLVQLLLPEPGALLHAIAWQYGLLMVFGYTLVGCAWRSTGFRLYLRSATGRSSPPSPRSRRCRSR
jgi:hypothetical protein